MRWHSAERKAIVLAKEEHFLLFDFYRDCSLDSLL